MPREIKRIFIAIILFGDPSNPKELWKEFKEPMREDYARQYENHMFKLHKSILCNNALFKIEP